MDRERLPRRDLLRAGGGLAALVATAATSGCQELLGDDGLPERSDPGVLRHVPESSIAAAHVDVEALLGDDRLRGAVDGRLGLLRGVVAGVPATTEDVLDRVASRVGLDPRGITEAVAFVARPPDLVEEAADAGDQLDPLANTARGAVVRSDWSADAVADALAGRADRLSEDRYRGYRRLVASVEIDGDDSGSDGGETETEPVLAVGVVDDGVLAIGNRRGVRGALDVAAGEESAEAGRLAEALGAARPGVSRVAVAPRRTANRGTGFGDPVTLLAGKIDVAYGTLYADGERRGVELVLESGSGFDAEDVHESVESVLALARSGGVVPVAEPLLRQMEATRSGSTVTLRYDAEVEAFATTILSVGAAIAIRARG